MRHVHQSTAWPNLVPRAFPTHFLREKPCDEVGPDQYLTHVHSHITPAVAAMDSAVSTFPLACVQTTFPCHFYVTIFAGLSIIFVPRGAFLLVSPTDLIDPRC